ncbi:MAG: hypothetical protein A3B99_04500 [Candidatus Yanofskybacteria bacterium RIFCSPHIGHO2_02_FULL_44_12b]|uniref:Uncharacterized protein n=2 Tax=Candidatus Yanofskyibacteriota TaxID=1752733 RepID=A0A1F8GMR2_9BACT|nr:MAG: hypothetical protein UW79_C0013G0040 [Candidatus Yanofskybacteria bacterium GW2011_GWA2_44_9]OGN04331.1 MAG: hypothetical protein A2659_03305 [Candidatus Yanofskybacteria bacterium RIFCSPHIGHO2_01_FULL_44_24]OGN14438.1 MAG: hypothetical protein A3B99_04500 [Candidatus Yanofskybacteria bacterium RIFCSPHIGHO2_02_FULL_44_12b]OGN25719.1 MAG: hypothetical protein A2925_00840 [Candidatus Yanofskybacteria bacterium RIFCSPLOWO2_01_FULL_44_22]
MPCDIGYKQVSRVTIPRPIPKKFTAEIKPPSIDRDLLAKIGEEDEAFLYWINDLDIRPLLQEALRRTVSASGSLKGLKIDVNSDGSLKIEGSYNNEKDKGSLERLTKQLSDRFQMDVLAIVAELLDYQIQVSWKEEDGETVLVLEGEKHQHSHAHVNRYLKVTKNANGKGSFRFEHFSSPEELKKEEQKFMALAQKLGVKISVETVQKSGHPIAPGTIHEHFLKEGN